MSKTLSRVREKLAELVQSMSRQGASSREIVDALRRGSPEVIREASVELEDIALVKEISSLRSRNGSASDTDPADDLFNRIGIAPVLAIPGKDTNGRSVPINRATPELTRTQIIAYIKAHERAKERLENDASKLRVLYERAEPFMIDDHITLGEALVAADAAGRVDEEKRG